MGNLQSLMLLKSGGEMDIRYAQFKPMSSEEWIQCVSNNDFTKEELCWIYGYCMDWCGLLTDSENLVTVTKAFLEKGMDPNALVTDDFSAENGENNYYYTPLISSTRFEDDQAAVESMKLLLENGGDPNTVYILDEPGENVFDFYVEEEFINGPYLDSVAFYGLLLCAAYGGRQHSGYMPFSMLVDEPISIFKDYNRYWYQYEENSSTMYIIEKETGRKIAKYH